MWWEGKEILVQTGKEPDLPRCMSVNPGKIIPLLKMPTVFGGRDVGEGWIKCTRIGAKR